VHRSGGSTAEQEVRCGGASGKGARGSTALWGLGLGFLGVRVPLFVGRRNGLGVRAGRGGSSGFSGGRCASGMKGRREERRDADVQALAVRGRKREEARSGWG
jgi:hypothetical protein